jgi:hypothetical protein
MREPKDGRGAFSKDGAIRRKRESVEHEQQTQSRVCNCPKYTGCLRPMLSSDWGKCRSAFRENSRSSVRIRSGSR